MGDSAVRRATRNLEYARDLVRGGQHLEHLRVGAFDVADLYRAAWVQAVSALDQWVHRELYGRALGFALNVDVPRPARFLAIKVPMRLFEDVHHGGRTLRDVFASHLRDQFGHLSFQAPEKIKEALAHISEVSLWPEVAKRMSAAAGRPVTSEQAQNVLKDIVRRRNSMAHEADRHPELLHTKQTITAQGASDAIESIHQIATAIHHVIGPPPPRRDQVDDTSPDHDGRADALATDAINVSAAVDRKEVTASSRNELYRQFWSRFQPIVLRHKWSSSMPPSFNWWNLPSGVTGVTWGLAFTRFGCRSEIYFEDTEAGPNQARWATITARRSEIIAHFGDDLIFDDLPDRKGCRIETRLVGPAVTDQDGWPDILLWMEDTQLRLRAAIDAMGGVPKI